MVIAIVSHSRKVSPSFERSGDEDLIVDFEEVNTTFGSPKIVGVASTGE